MRLTLVAAAAVMGLSGSAAFAWGDMYMGDGTNDPNSNFLVYQYNGPNYCPQGLQPVVAGGVICCGTPNAGVYHPMPTKKKSYRQPQMVVGEKGVVYR